MHNHQDEKYTPPEDTGHWSFDNKKLSETFISHVNEQLPWYGMVTDGIRNIVTHYLPEEGSVIDIGCATGNTLLEIGSILKHRGAKYVGYEKSLPMAQLASRYIEGLRATIVNEDFCDTKIEAFDVAIANLTLMFMSYEKRTLVINDLLKAKRPGGVIITVDRMEQEFGNFGTCMNRLVFEQKIKNGATFDEVCKKDLSLAGVQRPLSEEEIPPEAISWFQFGPFVGWVF